MLETLRTVWMVLDRPSGMLEAIRRSEGEAYDVVVELMERTDSASDQFDVVKGEVEWL